MLVTTGNGSIQRILRRLLAGPNGFQLLVNNRTNLRKVAEAHAARLGGCLDHHLLHRHIGTRILLVVARSLGQLIRAHGDRQIAGCLVPVGLQVGTGQEGEELGNALVLFRLPAVHHPQRSATDDGVLRSTLNVRIVGQGGNAEAETGVLANIRQRSRGTHEHRAFAAVELGLRLALATAVAEHAVLQHLLQVADMLHVQRAVEYQTGIQAAKAIILGSKQRVVPGREAFQMHPGLPVGGVSALVAAVLHLFRGSKQFRPGLWRLAVIESGLLEGVLVVIEDRGRAVEREGEHLALGRGVITGDRRNVGIGIKALARILHDGSNRLDRPLGGHHRRCTDFVNLQDMRRGLGAIGCDTGSQRFVIVALEHRNNLVIGLRRIEFPGELIDLVVQRSGHRVPPLDFSSSLRLRCQPRQRQRESEFLERHGFPF